MKYTITLVCLLLVQLTAVGQEALRQKSTTKGLSVGFSGQYAFWNTLNDFNFYDIAQVNPGPGTGLRVGYGFNQRFEVALSADGAILNHAYYEWNKTILSHLGLSGRVTLGSTTSRFRPFAELGATLVGATSGPLYDDNGDEVDLYMRGVAFTAGAGVHYFLNPSFALSAQYSGSFGEFNQNSLSDGRDVPFSTAINTHRASLGLTWFVRGRR
jgi:opacity protein-like surface antigen